MNKTNKTTKSNNAANTYLGGSNDRNLGAVRADGQNAQCIFFAEPPDIMFTQ